MSRSLSAGKALLAIGSGCAIAGACFMCALSDGKNDADARTHARSQTGQHHTCPHGPTSLSEAQEHTGTPSTAVQVAEVLRQLQAMPPVARGQIRNDAAVALLQRLQEIDPQAAIAFAQDHPEVHGDTNLAADLFASWLDRDALAARAWLDSTGTPDQRHALLPALIATLASDHPDQALQLAGDLPGYEGELDHLPAFGAWNQCDEVSHSPREMAYAGIFREWTTSDPDAAAQCAMGIADAGYRLLALQEVAAKWMIKDADAALQWAQALPTGADRDAALDGLMPQWTQSAPAQAAATLAALDASPRRSHWLQVLGETWSHTDPAAALTWAQTLPLSSDQTQLIRSILATRLQADATQAANLTLSLPAGTARRESLNLILPQWAARDANAVGAWIASLPDAPARAEAMAALTAP